jgi:hypothetical protein
MALAGLRLIASDLTCNASRLLPQFRLVSVASDLTESKPAGITINLIYLYSYPNQFYNAEFYNGPNSSKNISSFSLVTSTLSVWYYLHF